MAKPSLSQQAESAPAWHWISTDPNGLGQKTYREVQVFLGFANFYCRFIHRYSAIAAPLPGLLKGSKEGKKAGPFYWRDDAETALQQLCKTFTEAPLLQHFNPERKIRVETDASAFAIAGMSTIST